MWVTYKNSVTRICQGRKPYVEHTSPQIRASSGSGMSSSARKCSSIKSWLTSAALMWPETADWQRLFVSSTKAPLPSLKEKIFKWTFCADVTPKMKVSRENTKVSSVYSFGKAIVFTLEHLFMLLLQWRAIMKHIPHINKLLPVS